jgi:hypothetical protein
MVSVSRTVGLAALLAAAPGLTRAETVPKGSYQAETLGRLELKTEQERLVAYAVDGGPCGFEPKLEVLKGELQGNVLVGRLTVCLKGTSCPLSDTLPILALYSPEDQSLTAYVRPREGCQAPLLDKDGLLVLQPVSPLASPASPQVVPRSSIPVAHLHTEKRDAEAAKAALDRGNRLLAAENWSGSASEFEQSITHDDRNWVAFFGLGTALLMRGQMEDAIDALNRARTLNVKEPSIFYNLACAYSRLGDKKQALGFLTQAVKLGFALADDSQDPVLDKLLGSDSETYAKYSALTQQAFANYHKASAGRRQQTEP